MKPAARRKLDREIAEALARPRLTPTTPLAEYAAGVHAASRNEQKRMHQALLKWNAIIVVDRHGKRTLLLRTGEMSNPEEGGHRVTLYAEDGPLGHLTRKSITRLAQDLASDLVPVVLKEAREDDVLRWMGTAKFEKGVEHVLEMQRLNTRR
jgi:hypothetical protein